MNNRLKETLSVFSCVGLLIGIGFYTGFFKEYNFSYFQNLFKGTSSDISSIKDNFKFGNINSTQTSRIQNYRTTNIPQDVLKGAELSGNWPNIFRSSKKVIFYVYDDRGSNLAYSGDFHRLVSESFGKSTLNRYYNFEPSDYYIFRNYNVGITGSTQMCNSLEECNAMREKASKRAAMQMFLDRCAKYVCIINPKKQEYIMLKDRNANDTINALNTLKNW